MPGEAPADFDGNVFGGSMSPREPVFIGLPLPSKCSVAASRAFHGRPQKAGIVQHVFDKASRGGHIRSPSFIRSTLL